jgi:hypothetical protein
VGAVILELLGCDGFEPGLAVGEGLAWGFALEDLVVELEDEEGAGEGFDPDVNLALSYFLRPSMRG